MLNNTTSEDFLITFFESKTWRFVRHLTLIIVLAIIIATPSDLNIDFLKKLGVINPQEVLNILRITVYIVYFFCLAMIYVNLFVLVPKYLFKNKIITYLIFLILLVSTKYCIEAVCQSILNKFVPAEFKMFDVDFKGYIESTTIAFVFLIATAGYRVFKKWVYESKQFAALKEATLKEELTNLKNQINPHFLFNTLNNLNTLIATDSRKASAVVLGLSDVLRFYLYEANKEKVLLKKDIEILKQVLELEKIRRDDFQFSLNFDNSISGLMVPPFIFTNFVENAIKHSVDNNLFSFVHIKFRVESSHLVFECENSLPNVKLINNVGGLGLQNVKRRLELIYNNEYSLAMNDIDNKYLVKLKLPL